MPLPIAFNPPAEGAIASYDYADITEGTGVVGYYGIKLAISGSEGWALTTIVAPSAGLEDKLYRLKTNGTYTFDLNPYNMPKRLRGTAYLTGTFVFQYTTRIHITTTIYKYTTASEEIAISSAICSPAVGAGVSGTDNRETFFIPIPLTTTNFGKGDRLRVKILVYKEVANYVPVNPLTSTEPGITATCYPLKLFIPYNLDL